MLSIFWLQGGSWQGFKGNGAEEDLIFRVERTKNKLTRTELEVFLVRNNPGDPTPQFKVKGCPFMRSCTIYKGNEIVAQVYFATKCSMQWHCSIVYRCFFICNHQLTILGCNFSVNIFLRLSFSLTAIQFFLLHT